VRLATLRLSGGTAAALIDPAEGVAIVIDGMPDVGALLATPAWRSLAAAAAGPRHPLSSLSVSAFAPVVPAPGKIVCVGLNYREHIVEMGRAVPEHPTLFAKYAESLIGAGDDILIPREAADTVDWEAELVVVVGETVRHADRERAGTAIAGYTAMNDVTVRGYQYRTTQWLQGKTFEDSTPLGPVLVTTDEMPEAPRLTTTVDGVRMQDATASDLVFDPADLVAYVSRIVTLNPGDLIATGTPGGVGQGMTPPRYLDDGAHIVVSVEGIGALRNTLRVFDPA
jgi:acylpyruvate hydrolase